MVGQQLNPEYLRAASVSEALEALSLGFRILAGGTDLYPSRAARSLEGAFVDISGVSDLRVIEPIADGWRIGAAATFADVTRASLPLWCSGLQDAAREIGGVQIQNFATVGGNVCNASPAADGTVALLALDARVIVASRRGMREVALADFVTGPRRCDLASDEMVLAFDIPQRSQSARASFAKLGHRRYLVISVVMASLVLECDEDETITGAWIAVGAMSARALRLRSLERDLVGQKCNRSIADMVEARHLEALTPLDDIRGTRAYRLAAASTLLRRMLESVVR
jgi:CO/xanthine dehydrogenase FAD-binding subunit